MTWLLIIAIAVIECVESLLCWITRGRYRPWPDEEDEDEFRDQST